MPVYEYRCSRGHHYERTEGFDAPREQTCPDCGASSRRQISLPAVIFKGSGFYSTDNRKSSRVGSGSSRASESTNGHDASSSDDHGHSHGEESKKVEAASAE